MLIKGQRIQLEDNFLKLCFKDANLSIVCTLLNGAEKTECVATSQNNSLNYIMFEEDKKTLSIDIGNVSNNIQKIEIAIISPSKLFVGIADVECGNYKESYDFTNEINDCCDAVLFELYKKNGKWELLMDGRCFENSIIINTVPKKEKNETTPQQIIPTRILANIKKGKRTVTTTCLECGYSGLMGVLDEFDKKNQEMLSDYIKNKRKSFPIWKLWFICLICSSTTGMSYIMSFLSKFPLLSYYILWIIPLFIYSYTILTPLFVFFHALSGTKAPTLCPNCEKIFMTTTTYSKFKHETTHS